MNPWTNIFYLRDMEVYGVMIKVCEKAKAIAEF